MVYCLTSRFHLRRLDLKRWLSNGQPTSKFNFGPRQQHSVHEGDEDESRN